MNKELLIEVGQALYGDQWQSAFARALDVTPRTMRYWVSGQKPIPDKVLSEVYEIIENSINKQIEAKEKIKCLLIS